MLYKLKHAYWDGKQEHRVGSVLDFPEGTAPKSAVPFEPEPAPAKSEAKSK